MAAGNDQKGDLKMREGIRAVAVLTVIAAAAFFWWKSSKEDDAHRRRVRETNAVEMVRAGPKVSSWSTAEGEFLQIDHPIEMFPGSLIVEVRHCFVWRDRATNTSSMQCEMQPQYAGIDSP